MQRCRSFYLYFWAFSLQFTDSFTYNAQTNLNEAASKIVNGIVKNAGDFQVYWLNVAGTPHVTSMELVYDQQSDTVGKFSCSFKQKYRLPQIEPFFHQSAGETKKACTIYTE